VQLIVKTDTVCLLIRKWLFCLVLYAPVRAFTTLLDCCLDKCNINHRLCTVDHNLVHKSVSVLTDGPAGVDDDDESDGGHFDGDVGNELFGEIFSYIQ
jgi:hypothetical protein